MAFAVVVVTLLVLCYITAPAPAAAAAQPLIEAWGTDSLRIRLVLGDGGTDVKRGLPGALDDSPPSLPATTGADGTVSNGNIKAAYTTDGVLEVTRVSDSVVLFRSLSMGLEPCGTVAAAQPRPPTGAAARPAAVAAVDAATCAVDTHNNTDWAHNDILVNGKLHPYPSNSTADCCQRCAQTPGCGGWSWSGPLGSKLPAYRNKCFLKTGIGAGSRVNGHVTGCVRGRSCKASPPSPAPAPPPVPEGCSTKAKVVLSWGEGFEAYGTGEHMNTHGISGRLPPAQLDLNASLPSVDMVGADWDFESCTVYSDSSGAEICIPWVIAATPGNPAEHNADPGNTGHGGGSYEYGLLWNMPNFGSMRLEKNGSTWVAHDPVNSQIDLFVTTYSAGAGVRGTAQAAKDIMRHYVDATGHSPLMPEWAAGYWHSPMGHATFNQSMVISAVDGLASRGIPTDLYVIDYFNWAKMGDYTFNPKYWPDPAAMVKHLASKGVRLMVSAWPYTLKEGARASAEIVMKGNGVRYPNGSMTPWPDSVCEGECYLYDPTNQGGRDFLFNMLDSGCAC
jgi:hypothetical protein